MEQNELVTKAYLDEVLAPLVHQNKETVLALRRAVYQHNYYMKTHGKRAKTSTRHKQEINKILKMVKRITKAAGLSRIQPNHKFADNGRFVRLAGNDFARLKALLAHNHVRCARVPNGLAIPYLSRNEVSKLRRIIKSNGKKK